MASTGAKNQTLSACMGKVFMPDFVVVVLFFVFFFVLLCLAQKHFGKGYFYVTSGTSAM